MGYVGGSVYGSSYALYHFQYPVNNSHSSTLTSSVAHSECPDHAALSSGIICSKRHKSSEINLRTLMMYEAKDKVMVMSLFESLYSYEFSKVAKGNKTNHICAF